jgi:hypothetical protein
MHLEPGERLSNGAHNAYDVVAAGWSNSRHAFFPARKVFWNLRHPDRTMDEAGPAEGLEVLIRAPLGPGDGNSESEWETVLAPGDAPWFLEPIDRLPPPDAPGPGTDRPLVVLADPHARRLIDGPPPDSSTASRLIRVGIEVLSLLDALHDAGLLAVGLDPGDFLLDREGRWFYLGTDRIRRGAAPEQRTNDLAAWGACVDHWLGGINDDRPPAHWPIFEALRGPRNSEGEWLAALVRHALAVDPTRRPTSVAALRQGAIPGQGPLDTLWRGLRRRKFP